MTKGRRRHGRAFTLMEVVIALAMGAIVLGTVIAVYAAIVTDHRRVQALSEMARDGTFVGQLLSKELRQAGLGIRVPSGPTAAQHTNAGYGTAPLPATFFAGVIVADTSQVGVLGDFPRPDANYPAYGVLHSRPTGSGASPHRVMWYTENNGYCSPDTNAGSCATGNFSVFFPGVNSCNAAGSNARTCPWGMRRIVANERLQVFAGDGSWVHAAAAGSTASVVSANGVVAMPLVNSFDVGAWPNTLPGDGPGFSVPDFSA